MSDTIALVASLVFVCWWLGTWVGGIVLVREFHRCLVAGNRIDALLLLAGLGANLAMLFSEWSATVAEWLHRQRLGIPPVVQGAGVVLSICFALIVVMSRRRLGQMWTVVPNAVPARLITAGPYSVVRHPIYAACVGFYSAMFLAFDSTIAAFVCLCQVVGFISKAAREDRLLSNLMTSDYDTYKRHVRWRLFWNVW